MMIVIITGNIGCGKSTVAKYLMENTTGLTALFDYDKMVKKLYTKEEFLNLVQAEFGTTNKKEISDIVFVNHDKLMALKALSRSYTDAALNQFITDNRDCDVVFMDVPLWFEDEMGERFPFDSIICVAADEETQYDRVKTRSGWDDVKVKSVIDNQLPQALKIAFSDNVISNHRDIEMLKAQVLSYIDLMIKPNMRSI